jgi:hypothetical protein
VVDEVVPSRWIDPTIPVEYVRAQAIPMLIEIARRQVEREGWCPFCQCTIGNGDVTHARDCVLYDVKDGA